MYAILDIEATGGQMGEEDIIEVAIYRYDGRQVVDQLISLVKPERSIDPYVQKLTHITHKMVKTAPGFHEIAKRVIEITADAVLVGHNVEFDYRMLKQEFKKLGYLYQRDVIDTVKLSEIYFPDTQSHSLGKLCKELGIPTSDRHRASGDARATLELFKLLLEKDTVKNISKTVAYSSKKTKSGLGYRNLPNAEGLFYVLDEKKNIIFLSSATNISQFARKTINSKTELGRSIRKNMDSLNFEITGNELISKIKEITEIKRLKPFLNHSKSNRNYSIYLNDKNSYKTVSIHKSGNFDGIELLGFNNQVAAREFLTNISDEFELCPKLNKLSPQKIKCFKYEIGECNGACESAESPDLYNSRFDQFLLRINTTDKNMLIIGKGRTINEKSFVWVNHGICEGYGYFEFHNQIKMTNTIKERMTKVETDPEIIKVIRGFLAQKKYLELISLDS